MTIKKEASLLATGSVEAPGNSGGGGTSDATASQYPLHSLEIEGCVYRGEGNANLVVALPSERKVIRLRKSSGDAVGSSSSSSNSSSSLKEEEAGVRREVDFIRRVISAHLGAYVCVPEIVRCDYPEIARLSDKIRPARPEHRRGKDVVGVYATKFPDYTYLADELSGYQSAAPTFCVEVKPKQAHLCQADRLFQKCPYCLTQYYKTQNGSIRQPSDYCPFDLFSGDAERIERALEALLHSPQNNLKIFKNGAIIYDESLAATDETSLQRALEELKLGSSALLRLLRCALARPFDVAAPTAAAAAGAETTREDVREEVDLPKRLSAELVERTRTLLSLTNQACDISSEQPSLLPVGSVLERILRMQRLHQRGADVVTWIHANLGTLLDDAMVYSELRDCQLARPQVQGVGDGRLAKTEGLTDYAMQDKALNANLKNDVFKYFTLDECYEILRNYLLFCTAKDCSILIAFQRMDEDSTIHENSINRIDISKGQSFLVSVRILDLDMKKLQCIEKHRRRDSDVLQATIKELEKQLSL